MNIFQAEVDVDIPTYGGNGNNLQLRRSQGKNNCHCIINARIGIQDYFFLVHLLHLKIGDELNKSKSATFVNNFLGKGYVTLV